MSRRKKKLFHIETETVSTLPYLDQGHGTQQCPVEELLSLCNFILRPHTAGDKTRAVGGSKGRVPGFRHTHTHQNTSSVLQTTVSGT